MSEAARWLERAWQNYHQQNFDGAIDALCRALGEEPDDAPAHALLAIVLINKKRLHAALHEARAALAIEPELPLALYALALALTGQRQLREAAQLYERLVNAAEPYEPALLGYAALKGLQGKPDDALPLLRRAIELDPDDAHAHAKLAEWHLRRGDDRAAEAAAREALALSPELPDALACMGFVLLKRGRVEEAREHALWALRTDPQDVGALQLLSAVKARSNPLLGLWWRWNVWLSALGEGRTIVFLIGLFLAVQVLQLLLGDMGHEQASRAVSVLWLAFAVYTWVGPLWFARAMQKELRGVDLSPRY